MQEIAEIYRNAAARRDKSAKRWRAMAEDAFKKNDTRLAAHALCMAQKLEDWAVEDSQHAERFSRQQTQIKTHTT